MNLDVRLSLGPDGVDLELEAGDLRGDPTLRTAALISLLTDARAGDANVVDRPELAGDRRGWWADDLEGEPWGGLLWTLERDKATPQTRERGRGYLLDALGWFTADGLAADLEVTAELAGGGRVGFDLALTRGRSRLWESAWAAMEADPLEAEDVDVVLRFL